MQANAIRARLSSGHADWQDIGCRRIGQLSLNASLCRAYRDGIAVLMIAKGGLMYQAAIAGQKYSYKTVE